MALSRPLRIVLLPLLAVAGVCVLGNMALTTIETVRRHLRGLHPQRVPVDRAAGQAALGEIRDVSFVTSDGLTLRGWYRPSRNRAAVILMHGGGAARGAVLPEASMLAPRGYGLLLFDFRAHGESEGDTCTWGGLEQLDLVAALDYLVQQPDVDPERIGVLGQSFGGSPAISVAAKDHRIQAVVAEGTAPTLRERIALDSGDSRWFTTAPSVWAVGREISLEAAQPVRHVCAIAPRPVLIISGDYAYDQPEEMARGLFDAACEPKEYWQIVGAPHAQYARFAANEMEQKLVRFFAGTLLEARR